MDVAIRCGCLCLLLASCSAKKKQEGTAPDQPGAPVETDGESAPTPEPAEKPIVPLTSIGDVLHNYRIIVREHEQCMETAANDQERQEAEEKFLVMTYLAWFQIREFAFKDYRRQGTAGMSPEMRRLHESVDVDEAVKTKALVEAIATNPKLRRWYEENRELIARSTKHWFERRRKR
jgi:hypothetical protein